MYATKCNTCYFDLSEYFYKKVVEKVSDDDIEKDITQSCCRMVFRGQFHCIKYYGVPKHSAIIRKSNNDIIPIQY